MLNSLNKLSRLPDETKVFCGHEYTLANLHFAQAVEPNNPQIKERLEKTRELRQKNLASVPSLLAEERLSNPFLRCDHPQIKMRIEKRTGRKLEEPVEIFTYLRQWKNNFK
jgi:hydroxyacylglutathione hydrolase